MKKNEKNAASTEERPSYSWKTRIKWTVVVFSCCVDMASMIALAPSISILQMETYARTTDCAAAGDCEALVSKRAGVSASIRSLLSLVVAAPYGVAADSYGRRPLFLIAACGPLLTLPLLLGNPSTLVPFYFMTTIGGLMPSSSQVITLMMVDLTSAGERFRVMSLFSLANMALALVANLLGAMVVARIGTAGILKVSIALTITEIVALFFCLPETSAHMEESEEEDEEDKGLSKAERRASRHVSLKDAHKAALKRQTSANIADVLFKSRKIDADHSWEAKAFWLYLLAELPDAIGASQLQFNIIALFGFTAADYGQLVSILMFYQFFWLALGTKILKMILPNEARIFQTLMTFTFVADVGFFLLYSTFTPYFTLFPATANTLIPITLQALILDVTAEHRQGKILGFLVATDRLCGVIGPAVGGSIFSMGLELFGTTRWIFLTFFTILKPLAVAGASFALIKEAMPEALQIRMEAVQMKNNMGSLMVPWTGI